MADLSSDPQLVLVSNRGPATFERAESGDLEPKRGGGGLVTALTGLVHHRDALWIASAMSDEDAEYVCGQLGIDTRRPMLCQVSRFDPWKDSLGVIDAYRIVKEHSPDVLLALVVSIAYDDLDVWDFLNATCELVGC